MEIMQEQAARVWQRVRPQDAGQPPEGIVLAMWENASAWAQLSRQTGGQNSAALRELSRREQQLCAMLRGWHRVQCGDPIVLPQTPPVRGSMAQVLRLSYDRCCRVCRELEGQSRTGAQVPRLLAELELEQSLRVLELLGRI